MAKRFTEKHEIPYYECDVTGRLTLPMVLNVLLKTSEAQSDSLNRGVDYLAEMGLGWVITQHELEIKALPRVGEVVNVSTQAATYNKYFCYRDFWIHAESGEEYLHLQTTFIMMNLESRKLTAVPDEVIAPFECEKSLKIKRAEKIEFPEFNESREYGVRYTDIDSNQHVNNTKYLEWMIDGLDYDFLTQHQAKQVTMNFDKEIYYGDKALAQTALVQADDVVSYHKIFRGEDQSSTAKIVWG